MEDGSLALLQSEQAVGLVDATQLHIWVDVEAKLGGSQDVGSIDHDTEQVLSELDNVLDAADLVEVGQNIPALVT